MHVVIVGCGRVGAQVASMLSAEGHSVAVIDREPRAFIRLGKNFRGITIAGVGFDRDVLRKAGIERADAFASVTNGDNSNIVSALIARNIFKVPRVVTRIYDPQRAEIYRRFGIPTISSTTWGANRTRELILYSQLTSVFSFGNGEVESVELRVPQRLVGRTVGDITVLGEISVSCVVRLGKAFIPSMGTQFEEGDLVYFTVLASSMPRLEQMLYG